MVAANALEPNGDIAMNKLRGTRKVWPGSRATSLARAHPHGALRRLSLLHARNASGSGSITFYACHFDLRDRAFDNFSQ